MVGNQKQSTSKMEKKGGKIIIVIGAIVIVALLVVIVFLLGRQSGQNKQPDAAETVENVPKRNVVVNEDNVDKVAEEIIKKEPVRSGMYEVTMNSEWIFADGSSVSENAYVENVANNTNDVYFDVNLADTDELIYSSPVIPLGSYLENIALDKDLDKGNYDCVLTYHLIDAEQKTLSTLKVKVTIIVQN